MVDLAPLYKVNLIVSGKQHFYDVAFKDGSKVRYPGTTGILNVINKPALIPWAKKQALKSVEAALLSRGDGQALTKDLIASILADASRRPDKIKDEAANFGTRTHAIVDAVIRGESPEVPEELGPPVEAFKRWRKESGVEFVLPDTKVASREYGYGGSFDALGRRNGTYVLIDVKTSSGFWPEYALQVGAYAQAVKETYGISCAEAWILRLGKTLPVDFAVAGVRNLKSAFAAFRMAKALKEFLDNEVYANGGKT